METEYKTFMAELGGGGGGPPPPSHSGPARPGLGSVPTGGSRSRPGDELPDDCKLYVGNLTSSVTDDTLKVGLTASEALLGILLSAHAQLQPSGMAQVMKLLHICACHAATVSPDDISELSPGGNVHVCPQSRAGFDRDGQHIQRQLPANACERF